MLECDYEVKQIDGDYAQLQRLGIYEGCILHYEMMQYSMK